MNQSKTILLVDDDPDVRRTIVRALSSTPYQILEASNGAECHATLDTEAIDLAIVDLGLPDADGLDIVRDIRVKGNAGILILSGRNDTVDKVIGIELGADDYLTKPFDGRELVARIKGILRRMPDAAPAKNSQTDSNIFEFDGWKLYVDRHALHDPEGTVVELTSGEYELLALMVQSPGRVLSRDQIMDGLYGDRTPAFDRSVDVRVGRLRKKITMHADEEPKIRTIRNAGYMFCARVIKK